jgi:hypothetical protein
MTHDKEAVDIAIKIEDEHYCGKRPLDVRLSTVIAEALTAYGVKKRNEGLEEAAGKVRNIISSYIKPMYKEAGELLNQDLTESCNIEIENISNAIVNAIRALKTKEE